MGFAGIFSNLWTLRKTGADTTICGALSKHRHNHWAEIPGRALSDQIDSIRSHQIESIWSESPLNLAGATIRAIGPFVALSTNYDCNAAVKNQFLVNT
jgi:hypothetical protein